MTNQTPEVHGVFPCPVSITKRDTNLSPEEEKEIGKIIKEEMQRNFGNSASNDTYIFDSKLKKLIQYCYYNYIKIQLKYYLQYNKNMRLQMLLLSTKYG